MRPSDKQSLPVQPPGQETKTSSDQPPPPPPPPPRIKTLNPSSRTQSSSPPPSSSSSSSPPEADRYAPRPQSSISLADAIGPQRSVSSFSSLTRLRSPTATLLSSLAASETAVTVLAPLNRAIDDLPRKPWESPSASDHDHDHDHDYDGPSGRDRAGRNLARFVEAHLVVAPSPWEQGTRATTLAGRQIWWEERARDGKRVVLPDEVEVDRVAARVANGELWFLKGVLNHE